MPIDRRPIICLVTNRQRFGVTHDAASEEIARLLAQIADAVDAGVDLIQIREPDLPARTLSAVVTRAVEAARGTPSTIVVNDRLDVALACGAGGVHLPAAGMPVDAARALAPPGFLIGRSVHSAAEAAGHAAADYLIAGTVFKTPSKPEAPLLGPAGLAAVVRASKPPVLAIGGVTLERLQEIAGAGAAGFAAIELFLPRAAAGTAAPLRIVVGDARKAFDRAKPAP